MIVAAGSRVPGTWNRHWKGPDKKGVFVKERSPTSNKVKKFRIELTFFINKNQDDSLQNE